MAKKRWCHLSGVRLPWLVVPPSLNSHSLSLPLLQLWSLLLLLLLMLLMSIGPAVIAPRGERLLRAGLAENTIGLRPDDCEVQRTGEKGVHIWVGLETWTEGRQKGRQIFL